MAGLQKKCTSFPNSFASWLLFKMAESISAKALFGKWKIILNTCLSLSEKNKAEQSLLVFFVSLCSSVIPFHRFGLSKSS